MSGNPAQAPGELMPALGIIQTHATLRRVITVPAPARVMYLVQGATSADDGTYKFVAWVGGSLSADDNATSFQPNDRANLPGRWLVVSAASSGSALIERNSTAITTGPLVADTVTLVGSFSISGVAGYAITAQAAPSFSIGTATSIQGEIRLDATAVPANLTGAGIDAGGQVLTVLQDFALSSTKTYTLGLYVKSVGGVATVGAGRFMYQMFR